MMKKHIISVDNICKFKAQLCLEEKSETTVGKYIHDINSFAKFLCGSSVTKEKAIAYKQHLMAGGYAVRNINSIIAWKNPYALKN